MDALVKQIRQMHSAAMGVELTPLAAPQVDRALQSGSESLTLVFQREGRPHSVVLGQLEGEQVKLFDPEHREEAMPLAQILHMVEQREAVCLGAEAP